MAGPNSPYAKGIVTWCCAVRMLKSCGAVAWAPCTQVGKKEK